MGDVIEKHYEYVIHNINPPYEIVAYKEEGMNLVVLNKKIAALVVDRRLVKINEDLQKTIKVQIEILRSNGKSR